MKNFVILSVLLWGIAFVLPYVWNPDAEAYGQTTLQFDKERQVYFVKTEDFQSDVEQLEKEEAMYAGMPVSFFKTSGCVMTVVSGTVSKDDFMNKAQQDRKKGCLVGAGFVWFLLVAYFLLNFRPARIKQVS